jgi:hypothetical protein
MWLCLRNFNIFVAFFLLLFHIIITDSVKIMFITEFYYLFSLFYLITNHAKNE